MSTRDIELQKLASLSALVETQAKRLLTEATRAPNPKELARANAVLEEAVKILSAWRPRPS
jgi:hypothetical protein